MLSPEAITEYQQTYQEVFGEEVSPDEALEQGTRLMSLFESIYQPIPLGEIASGDTQ